MQGALCCVHVSSTTLLQFYSIIIHRNGPLFCLPFLSQNMQGLTQDKEDVLLKLMDRLQLDLVSLQETWQEPQKGFSKSENQFIFHARHPVYEIEPETRDPVPRRRSSRTSPSQGTQPKVTFSGYPDDSSLWRGLLRGLYSIWTYTGSHPAIDNRHGQTGRHPAIHNHHGYTGNEHSKQGSRGSGTLR